MKKLGTILWLFLSRCKRTLQNFRADAAAHHQVRSQPATQRYELREGTTVDATSTIGPASSIGPNVTVQHSTIGRQSTLDNGASILDSALGSAVFIGKQSTVRHSTLADHTHLEAHVLLHNSSLQPFVLLHPHTTLHNSHIQSYSYIGQYGALENTTVGKFCSIAQGFICAPGNHPTHMLSTSPAFYLAVRACGITFATEDAYVGHQPCSIGNDVWVGANVFIKAGTTIGDGAIIAAGSVVVKDVPPYAIVAGVPAKVLRKRYSEQDITALLHLRWWDWPEEMLRQAVPIVQEGSVQALVEFGSNAGQLHKQRLTGAG